MGLRRASKANPRQSVLLILLKPPAFPHFSHTHNHNNMSISLTTPTAAAAATTELTIGSEPEYSIVGLGEQPTFRANVTLTAPTMPEEEDASASRAPVNLVFVIDRSGSMASENKLKLVKKTLTFAVGQMKETDTLGLVTFDDSVATNLPLTRMDKNGRAKALAAIKPIATGGCTNLSGGLLAGLELLRNKYGITGKDDKKKKAGWWPFGRKSSSGDEKEKEVESDAVVATEKPSVDSVILLTDGLANGGIRDTAGIVRAMKNLIESLPSVCTVSTMGYGSDHDVAMLEAIAEAGHGGYNFVESADKVADAFGDTIGGLMSVTAQQIKLTVAPPHNMGIEIADVETTYEKKHVGNGMWEISMGDLYSEEERDVLVVFKKLPSVEVETAEYPLLAAQVEYVDVIAGVPRSADASCLVKRAVEVPSTQKRNEKVDIAINRSETAALLRNAGEAADRGDAAQVRILLQQQQQQIKSSAWASSKQNADLLCEISALEDDLSAPSYAPQKASKMMFAASNSHAQQRSYAGASRMEGGGAYVTNKKKSMKSKFM